MTGTAGDKPERKESWNDRKSETTGIRNDPKAAVTTGKTLTTWMIPARFFSSSCNARFTIWRKVLRCANSIGVLLVSCCNEDDLWRCRWYGRHNPQTQITSLAKLLKLWVHQLHIVYFALVYISDLPPSPTLIFWTRKMSHKSLYRKWKLFSFYS